MSDCDVAVISLKISFELRKVLVDTVWYHCWLVPRFELRKVLVDTVWDHCWLDPRFELRKVLVDTVWGHCWLVPRLPTELHAHFSPIFLLLLPKLRLLNYIFVFFLMTPMKHIFWKFASTIYFYETIHPVPVAGGINVSLPFSPNHLISEGIFEELYFV